MSHTYVQNLNLNMPKALKVICDICNKSICSSTLRSHIEKVHLNPPELCPKCGKIFGNLQKHLQELHSEVCFPCSICDFSSKRKGVLIEHMMRIHDISANIEHAQKKSNAKKCKKCDFTSTKQINLQIHEARIHGVKLQCNTCDYRLFSLNSRQKFSREKFMRRKF